MYPAADDHAAPVSQVVLPSGRIIEGDLACLDKQGNLILSNAAEHLPSSSSSSSQAGTQQQQQQQQQPATTQLGMVLVPKAQQQEVSLRVSLSEKAAMLSLTGAA
jgi:small nuclear ribonucleoprotein (snRNP)-like protein